MSSTVANGNTEDVQQRLLNERATLSPRRNPMAAMLKSKTGKANTNTGGEQCDEEKSRLQGEIDSLRAEVKDLKFAVQSFITQYPMPGFDTSTMRYKHVVHE